MKVKIVIALLLLYFTSFAQLEEVVGEYAKTLGDGKLHSIIYTLSINADKTFTFHSYTYHKNGIPPKVNLYGKGTWELENKVLTFFSDKQNDFDAKHTLNFNDSKARFVKKSPRDKTDRVVKTSLQFFQSEIFWVENMRIDKV